MKFSTILSCLALALPFSGANPLHRRHQEVAHRARGDVDLQGRSFTGGRFTFYDVGLGACGIWNKPTDLIVALNAEQFGEGYPGPNCFKSITILYNGKLVEALITDRCEDCQWAGLDFSRGLFNLFADEAVGVLYGAWWYNQPSPST